MVFLAEQAGAAEKDAWGEFVETMFRCGLLGKGDITHRRL